MPAGTARVEVWKGFEYRPAIHTVSLADGGQAEVRIEIERAAPDLGGQLQVLLNLDQRRAGPLVNLSVLLFSVPLDGPPDLVFSRRLMLVLGYQESQRSDKAAELLAAMRKTGFPKEARLVEVYNRLRGMVAASTGQDRAEAAASLAADLAKPGLTQRASSVGVLVDLYQAMEKYDQEESLISQEMAHPEIKGNAPLVKLLRNRLTELQQRQRQPDLVALENLSVAQPAKPPGSLEPSAPLAWLKMPSLKRTDPGLPNVLPQTEPGRTTPLAAPVRAAPLAAPGLAVGKKMQAYLPDWYDYVGPKDLSDPRLRQFDDVLRQPWRHLDGPEVYKLWFLVADDVRQPAKLRDFATTQALLHRQSQYLYAAERQRFVDFVLGDQDLSPEVRRTVLLAEMLSAAQAGAKEKFGRLGAHALASGFSPEQKADQVLLARWAASEPVTGAGLLELARDTAGAGLTKFRAEILQHLANELLLRGDTATLRQLLQALAEVASAPAETGFSPETFQLELARLTARVELLAPIHQGLAATVFLHFPHAPPAPPPAYEKFLPDQDRLIVTEPGTTLDYLLSRLKTGRFERKNFSLWHLFWLNLPRDEASNQLALQLAEQALALSPSDEVRAELVSTISSSMDWDNPLIRDALTQRFAAHRKVEEPLTYAQIRFHEIEVALRRGQAVDLDNAFTGLENPELERVQVYLRLKQYLVAGNKVRLRRELERNDAGILTEPALLPLALRAYELLGMTTEAGQSRRLLTRQLHRSIDAAWVLHDEVAATRAANLADALHATEGLPSLWLKHLGEELPDALRRWRILGADALLRQDWSLLLLCAKEQINLMPTAYRAYWYKGLALARLHQSGEARVALKIYLQYCHSDLEYPEAKKLLAGLDGE